MRPKQWDVISDDAKGLVRSLLAYDQNERISADQALAHPWLKVCLVNHAEHLLHVLHVFWSWIFPLESLLSLFVA